MGSYKCKAQSEILSASGKAQQDSRTHNWDQRNSTSCLRPGLAVYYWTNRRGKEDFRPSFTSATHGRGEKGKSCKCHQSGVAEMASCPNPVPLLPGHIQTDPISQPLLKLGVAKWPMEQTDMHSLKPLTHNPSCSFPYCELVHADMHGDLGTHVLKMAELPDGRSLSLRITTLRRVLHY